MEGWRIQFWKGVDVVWKGGRCGLKGGECSLEGGRYGLERTVCVQHEKARAERGREGVGRALEGYFERPVLQGAGF